MVRVSVPSHRPRVFPAPLPGASVETLESRALEGNPLGDPATRSVAVYRPPSGSTEGLPLLVFLPGFARGGAHLALRPSYLGETEFGLFDRLVRAGACPEAVLVAPDCLTTLGGSQYVNSTSTGRYADFVVNEVVPWARERYRTRATGILGQSSGGFGALHLSMLNPGVFSAVGSSAGDIAFDLLFPPDIPRAVRAFREFGGPEAFLDRLFREPWLLKGPADPSGSALLLLAMSACYSSRNDGSGAFDVPFDPETGGIDPPVWDRWLAYDPLVRLERDEERASLARLRRLHLTASSGDEWFLDVAARRFAHRLEEHGVPVVYDELPGGHFDKRPRFEKLFASLVRALSTDER